MGEWLRSGRILPDEVLVSSSARTMETFDRLRRAMPELPRPRIEALLYHADAETLLARIRKLPDDVSTVLVIAHQPGLGEFVRLTPRDGVPSHCCDAFERFPTATVAVINVESDTWADAAPEAMKLTDYARPRQFM